MFNLLQNASDDTTAIGACLLIMAGAAFLVFVSYHLGPAGQKLRKQSRLMNGSRVSSSQFESGQTHERAA